jgi:hypothetical protein
LEKYGAADAPSWGGHTLNERNRAAEDAAEDARRRSDARARVGAWVDQDRAQAATSDGRVAPIWREIERRLSEGFRPPFSVVHQPSRSGSVADRLGSYAKQLVGVITRGEAGLQHPRVPGSHVVELPPGRSIDPSYQSYYGVPEGLNLRAMPLEQQLAAVAARGQPAEWLRVEVEVETDGQGGVTAARVVLPSGRRTFDRFALAEVRARIAATAPKSATRSRWLCEAGYSVADLTALGFTFDETTGRIDGHYPLQQNVSTHVSLRWVHPADADATGR